MKELARSIQPKWKDLALALGFTEIDCQQFENNNNLNLPWWPGYMLLRDWIHKLSPNELERWKQILTEAIQPLDEKLAAELF